MENIFEPFEFKQCISIIKSTGRKSRHLRELRDILAIISDESIYHHTYQYFLRRQIIEYNNDFAHWAGESLEERVLSEYFSNIDPFSFKDINELRKALLNVIDDYLTQFPEPREVIAGDEFYFNEAVMLLFPAGVRANNLAEFLIGIKYVDLPSVYYHFYEARVRHRAGMDDFSKWVKDTLGREELAMKIRAIDPIMHTLEGIRKTLKSVPLVMMVSGGILPKATPLRILLVFMSFIEEFLTKQEIFCQMDGF